MQPDVPKFDITLDLENKEKALHDCAELCVKAVPSWYDICPSTLKVAVQSGGVTNALLKVTDGSLKVLCRIFGEGTEHMIDRNKEMIVLSHFQPVFAKFGNGFVYSYIPGDIVTYDLVQDDHILVSIAQALCQFHKELDHIPLPAEPVWTHTAMDFFLNLAQRSLAEHEKGAGRAFEPLQAVAVDRFRNVITKIKARVTEMSGKNECNMLETTAHNDLTFANIIYDSATGHFGFIDNEYTHYNYNLYDIANHFCEWGGLKCDWELFPTDDQAKTFLLTYLEDFMQKSLSDQTIAECYEFCLLLCMVSNVIWSLWAIPQAINSKISFNYMEYFWLRVSGLQFINEEKLAAPLFTKEELNFSKELSTPLSNERTGLSFGRDPSVT